MANSVFATFKAAPQATKGTAATTGFHCGVMQVSGMGEEWELPEKGSEHGCAAGSTVYRDKSQRVRTFYRAPWQAEAYLYPNLMGVFLRMIGMAVATSGTTIKTHVFTAAAAGADVYGTLLSDIGADSGTTVERRAVDAKATKIDLTADQSGIKYTVAGDALSLGIALGTETKTDEPAYNLLPSNGTFALTIDPGGTPVVLHSNAVNPPKSIKMTIDSPVQDDDMALFTSARAALNRSDGIRVEGSFEGLKMIYDNYRRLMWGGVAGTAPSASWLPCSIDYKFNTAEIVSASTPYSDQITIPRAEVWFDPASFRASGNDIISWTAPFRLFAGTGTPLTWTKVNAVTGY